MTARRPRWLAVWNRAVIRTAWRRALPVWIGCGIVAPLLFGPTAMHPSDVTGLALGDPGFGAVLVVVWLLVFVPTARLIVRPTAAAYLSSLPGDPWLAWLVAAAALIWLQLPWLTLWLSGEGAWGAMVVAGVTLAIVALARWQPPGRRLRPPTWRSAGQALRSIHRRALVRRAGDVLLRGAGLAVLAGLAAGLMIRNNERTGVDAGVLGASVISVVLIPAQIAPALTTLAAYRETAWLAQAYGISPGTRIGALAASVALVHVTAAAIAAAAAMVVAAPNAWLAVLAIATALSTALLEVRTIVLHEAAATIAMRVVVGAIAAAAVAVVSLSVLDELGAVAMLALGFGAVIGAAR